MSVDKLTQAQSYLEGKLLKCRHKIKTLAFECRAITAALKDIRQAKLERTKK